MSNQLTLHIQQNTTVPRIREILDFIKSERQDLEELHNFCGLKPSVLQKVVFPFLRSIGIQGKGLTLTDLGEVAYHLSQLHTEYLGDFLHLQIIKLFDDNQNKRFSWVYRSICEQLWIRKEVELSVSEKRRLVIEITNLASDYFGLPEQDISISANSITGVTNYLDFLMPDVIKDVGSKKKFCCRYFCAAPIVVKTVDWMYQLKGLTYGVKLNLRDDIKNHLCQTLLLHPDGLSNVLSSTKNTYDYDTGGIFDHGYEGGYGQWIMLTESPEWMSLL